jgi:hypothetical protein
MSKKNQKNLEILPELEEYVIPLKKEEYAQLEKNILKEGCREPLTVWPNKNTNILIDGHNRYKICSKHAISFKISEIFFKNIDEAKIWIINNQLGRRNLNPDQMSYYRGLKYESIKRDRGGYSYVQSKGQSGPTTAEIVAREFKVGVSTIKRDSKYARGIDFIGTRNQELKKKILNGDVKINRSTIKLLSDPEFQKKIRILNNEIELENKVELIRGQILEEVSRKLNPSGIEEESLSNPPSKDELFLSNEDKIIRIKGMILSNLNKAIKNRDVNSLEGIRRLVDRLQTILE